MQDWLEHRYNSETAATRNVLMQAHQFNTNSDQSEP